MKTWSLPAVIFLALNSLACANQEVCFPHGCAQVEVAKDIPAIKKGMNDKKTIKENEGMLYILPSLYPAAFWTKGMSFPIDIIWMDPNKKVILIVRNLAPCLEDACPLYIPVDVYISSYVLEVSAGFAQRNDIKVGDQVKFSSQK